MAKRVTTTATAAAVDSAAGRPPGSQNREYVPLKVLPPACPRCEGTAFTPREQTVTRDISGEIDGRVYNRIVWAKACCEGCGQWVTFREYHLVGS